MVRERLERNGGLDALKCICALLVICIHFPLNCEIGKYIVALARVAVPIFFMITGYYYNKTVDTHKGNYQILKIIKLIIISNIIYFSFGIVVHILKHDFNTYISLILSPKSIMKLVVFNESPFGGHLWYLNALLYTLLCYKYLPINKIIKYKKSTIIVIAILLICDLVFGKYSILFFKKEFDYVFVRNFIFVGLPYFTIGLLLNNTNYNYNNKSRIANLIFVLFFIVLLFVERRLLVIGGVNATRDHYINTTFLSIALFILFYNKIYDFKFINVIGRKHTTNIYVYHPIIGAVLVKIIGFFNVEYVLQYFYPIIIFIFALLFSIVINYIKKHFQKNNISIC